MRLWRGGRGGGRASAGRRAPSRARVRAWHGGGSGCAAASLPRLLLLQVVLHHGRVGRARARQRAVGATWRQAARPEGRASGRRRRCPRRLIAAVVLPRHDVHLRERAMRRLPPPYWRHGRPALVCAQYPYACRTPWQPLCVFKTPRQHVRKGTNLSGCSTWAAASRGPAALLPSTCDPSRS